jgi:predicted RNA-binding protein with PIN domain
MPTLIDGYNLLHAMGRLTPHSPPRALQSARRSLLLQVRAGHGPEAGEVTVVFDAHGAPPGAATESVFEGVQVRFARGQTADDLIEEMIRAESSPRFLVVVSDDHRIQQAARRRGCRALGCLDYCETLLRRRPTASSPGPAPPIKPEQSSAEETRRWLEAFGELDDPLLRDEF